MLEHLSALFGSNIGSLYLGSFANPILQDIFAKFNIIIFSIAFALIAYTSLLSTINTAQDGKILGKKLSSFWFPLRSVLGLGIMLPINGSGYSLLQTAIIWLIIQAGSFANHTWESIVEYLEQGISITDTIEIEPGEKAKLLAQGKGLAIELLNSAICLSSLQQLGSKSAYDKNQEIIPPSNFVSQYGQLVRGYQIEPTLIKIDNQQTEYAGYFNIGIKKTFAKQNLSNDSAELCGSYKVKANVHARETSKIETSQLAKQATQQKLFALEAMFFEAKQFAKTLTKLDNKSNFKTKASIEDYLSTTSKIYLAVVSNLVARNSNQAIEGISELFKTDWTMIGASYLKFSHASLATLLETAVFDKPEITNIASTNIATVPSCDYANLNDFNYQDAASMAYLPKFLVTEDEAKFVCAALANAASITTNSNNLLIKETDEYVNETLHSLNQGITTFFHEINKNPINKQANNIMVKQVNFGKNLIVTSEQVLADMKNLTFNISTIAAVILWLCGIMLVFYLPLIPCIMYTVAVLGWFLLVIENIVIMPIAALGLILPGNNMFGKLNKNLSLPFNTLARPVTMVISFIIAMRLYKVGIELINYIILHSFPANFSTISSLSPVITIIIYLILVIFVANFCFALPYKIPNKLAEAAESFFDNTEINFLGENKSINNNFSQSSTSNNNQQAGDRAAAVVNKQASSVQGNGPDPSGLK